MEQRNFNQDATSVLLDLIKDSNPESPHLDALTPALLNFDTPTVNDGEGANTSLRITVDPESEEYVGAVVVNYNRLDAQVFADRTLGDSLRIPVGCAETVYDLLEGINERLGLQLTEGDIGDATLGEWEGLPNEEKHLDISITNDSYLFFGILRVVVEAGDQEFRDLFGTVALLAALYNHYNR